MNKNTLNSAVKKYGNLKNEAEIKEALGKDSKNFSVDDINEIYEVIISTSDKPKTELSKPAKEKNINDGLGLEDINYENFMPIKGVNDDGEETLKASPDFLKYKEVEKKLILNKQYKFDQLKAYGQFRQKANGDSVLVGIQIISFTPINSPTVEARYIIGLNIRDSGMNAQIHNPSTPPTNSRFFILKK